MDVMQVLSIVKRDSSADTRRYGDGNTEFFQIMFCIVHFVMWIFACIYLIPDGESLVQLFACSPDYPEFRYCSMGTWLKPIPKSAETRNAIKGMHITRRLLIVWAVFTQL